MTERKTETIHLELLTAELAGSRSEPKLIISGVRSNSRKEPGDQPWIDIHVDIKGSNPEYLANLLSKEMDNRLKNARDDSERFVRATKLSNFIFN